MKTTVGCYALLKSETSADSTVVRAVKRPAQVYEVAVADCAIAYRVWYDHPRKSKHVGKCGRTRFQQRPFNKITRSSVELGEIIL